MPTEEFVMRGQTASGKTEVLNFGSKHGYGFRLLDFQIYPSTAIGSQDWEIMASITAGKTAVAPTDPTFDNEGLIATAFQANSASSTADGYDTTIVNDTFIITQNLILMVQDSNGNPINWQCRFKPVKMSEAEMANANLRQFHVFDE